MKKVLQIAEQSYQTAANKAYAHDGANINLILE